jgi:hypothetical protein
MSVDQISKGTCTNISLSRAGLRHAEAISYVTIYRPPTIMDKEGKECYIITEKVTEK